MAQYSADYSKGAVNPYNFVRLGQGVKRAALQKGDNTGVIHCRLTNATPLSIPDMPLAEGKKDEHQKADFIKLNGRPIIPGSEIRGVIRSAYETLSNSCLSVNNNNILSARSADVRAPGILRFENDGKWHLYEADARKLAYDGSEDFDETADTFKRKWRNYRYEKGPDGRSRAVRSGGKIEVTYKFSTCFKEIIVDDLDMAVSDYKEVCKKYESNPNEKHLKKYITYPDKKPNICYPVYYLKYSADGKKYVYLSPAQISRSVFRKKVDDLLGEYCHCTELDNLCDACRLFGMTGLMSDKNEPASVASRVRFCDAEIINEPHYIEAILKELSEPKISSAEFYSGSRDMKTLWTYDTPGTVLNGRKYYFHHDDDNYSTSEQTKRNMTTKLIDKGAVFAFDVYFENITDQELRQLVWVLTLGENDSSGRQMHKLGHGKPLGLGSVKITVDSIVQRSFDADTFSYTEKSRDVGKLLENVPFDTSADYFRDFMCITDFTYLDGEKVGYPYGDDKMGKETSVGALTWFTANHNDGQMVKSKDKCTISYHLPRITDKEKLVLPALIKSGTNQFSDNKSKNNKKNHSGFDYQKQGTSANKTEMRTIICPKCHTKQLRPSQPIPTRQITECEKCGNSFKANF
ncbi:MAG: TIGR03986 family CRISPR-associated RAMP protein [Oscillospiraceae bacterium]